MTTTIGARLEMSDINGARQALEAARQVEREIVLLAGRLQAHPHHVEVISGELAELSRRRRLMLTDVVEHIACVPVDALALVFGVEARVESPVDEPVPAAVHPSVEVSVEHPGELPEAQARAVAQVPPVEVSESGAAADVAPGAPAPAEVVASSEAEEAPARATAEQIQEMVRAFKHGKQPTPRPPAAAPQSPWPPVREWLTGALGLVEAAPRGEMTDVITRVELLEGLSADSSLKRFEPWPGIAHVAAVELLVAANRALQHVEASWPPARQRLLTIVHRISRHMKTNQAGYAYGLALAHKPRHGSWHEDARAAAVRLRDMSSAPLLPWETPPTEVAVEEADDTAADEHDLEVEVDPTASWPHAALVAGKRAALLGGRPDRVVEKRLLDGLGLSSLDWVEGQVRQVDALAAAVAAGSYDIVLVLGRFISHKHSIKLVAVCKQRQVPFAFVRGGHGVAAARRAIERYFASK